MAANLTPQAQRSLEKKNHIFNISMEMFRDQGYNQTTIRDICAAAGVTTGTFYNFFGDKFGILQEHYNRMVAERTHILEFTANKLSNPYQAICDYFYTLSVMSSRFGKELSKEFSYRSPEMMSGIANSTTGNGIHHIALFLNKAQDFGSICVDTNPWHTAEYLVAGYMGMMQYWQNFSNGETIEEIARRMLPMFFAVVTDQHLEIASDQIQ